MPDLSVWPSESAFPLPSRPIGERPAGTRVHRCGQCGGHATADVPLLCSKGKRDALLPDPAGCRLPPLPEEAGRLLAVDTVCKLVQRVFGSSVCCILIQ